MRPGKEARRRREPRPGDRRSFRIGKRHIRGWPIAAAAALVVAVLAPIAALKPEVLRPLVDWLPKPRFGKEGPAAPRMTVEEALLRRQREGLADLLTAAEAGSVFPTPLGTHALVAVDQGLVERLLQNQVPSKHVIADRYTVALAKASAVFEDGFALVRLEGRVSLRETEESVFADLTVLCGLSVPTAQDSASVLRAQVHVIAVDARHVTLGMESRRAERLVDELGQQALSQFTALLPALEIPVRHHYDVAVPAVGQGKAVEIPAATLPVRLDVLQARAFAGKLWVLMGARAGAETAPVAAAEAPERTIAPMPDGGVVALPVLKQEHEILHSRLERAVADDVLLRDTAAVPGDVVTAVGSGFVRQAAGELARRYFDDVRVDLPPLTVRKSGVIHKPTIVGRIAAGDWNVVVKIGDARGRLRAGTPVLSFAAPNVVSVTVPVSIVGGRGAATVDFAWNARGVANLMCRDFQATRRITGSVVAGEHQLAGRFVMSPAGSDLRAAPQFDRTHHLSFDLDPVSWASVRAALVEQDQGGRCGMGMDAAKVEADLRALLSKGFDIKLPEKIFRPLALPTTFATSVQVGEAQVAVSLDDLHVRVSQDALWLGATVGVGTP